MKLTKLETTIDKSILGTLVCALFLTAIYIHTDQIQQQARFEKDAEENAQALLYSPVSDLALQAHAAYVFDITQNKPIYVKHEAWKLPLASLAKIMTTIVAKENLPEDAVVTIPHFAVPPSSATGLKIGEKWPLSNLLKLMLVASSNYAAHAVAEAVEAKLSPGFMPETDGKIPAPVPNFMQKMNETALSLGLSDLSFTNETGLDLSPGNASDYGSAHDIAMLLKFAYNKYPDLFAPTASEKISIGSENGTVHTVKNTDTIASSLSDLLASKTGYTKTAGGNLAILFEVRPDEPVIAVVLGSTEQGRFADMQMLVEAAHGWRDRIDTSGLPGRSLSLSHQ